MKLEISSSQSTEPLLFNLLLQEGGEPINVREDTQYKIQLNCVSEKLLAVFLGNIQLDFELNEPNENIISLKYDVENHPSIATSKHYSFFRNNGGPSELRFIFKGMKSELSVPLHVIPKVPPDLINFWLERMFETFPLVAIPPQIALMTLGDAKPSKGIQHISLAYLMKLVKGMNERIRKGIHGQRFLAFNKRPSSRHTSLVRSSSLMKKGVGKNTNHWRLTNFDSQSIVRKGLNTFELEKFPKTRLVQNYDLGINKALTILLKQTSNLLTNYARNDSQNPLFNIAPKSIIIGRKSHYKVVNDFSLELKAQASNLTKIRRMIEQKFIDKHSIKPSSFDLRFSELSKTISSLKSVNYCLKGLMNNQNKNFPLPTIDYIFEMFCFAVLHDRIQRNGFVLESSEIKFGVPFHSVFFNQTTNMIIRLYYETSLSGYDDQSSTLPLYDSRKNLQSDNLHKPDFIIEFEQNNKSFIAVLDAKYKNKKGANETLSLKSKSIVTKYFCYKVNNPEIAMPPCFIGAMYYNEGENSPNDAIDAYLSREFRIGGQKSSYLQVYGIGITQNPDEEIDVLLKMILNHVETLSASENIFKVSNSQRLKTD